MANLQTQQNRDTGISQIEQEECDKRFTLIEKIGEGTYGVVYKAVDLQTNMVSYNFIFPLTDTIYKLKMWQTISDSHKILCLFLDKNSISQF